jgi:4-hydroxyacetophenone monooxygenase
MLRHAPVTVHEIREECPMSTHDLAEILAHADRRTLAAVVTHLAGDPNAVPDLRDRDQIEARAAEVLPPFLSGERTAEPPDDEVLQAAMNLAVGAEVPAEYRVMAREQAGIGPIEAPGPLAAPGGFHVLIIGAGVTGVLAARSLDQLGLTDFTIVDRNPEPGGTWYVNQYPGCRVDTPSMLYSYSFDPDPDWPEHFSHQPELLRYVKKTADEADLGDRLRCSTEVEAMTWDEEAAVWQVDLRHVDTGATERLEANAVIAALGILRVAKYPNIEGRERFAGPALHSTTWDHDVEVANKRIGVIGSGASANQIVPALAPVAEDLIVYQRSPHWMMAHPKYGKMLEGIEKALFAIPTYREWNRFSESWKFGDGVTPLVEVDPDWPDLEHSISEANDRFRATLAQYIESQVGDRPDLMDKCMPDFPPYGKRLIVDNGWYQALRRDNVRLETSPITEITETGVTTRAGHDELDVLVYATGFQADKVLWPIRVTGRGGADITARMDADPVAYLGIAAADAPNLFITPGPNGIPGHAGNGMLFAECHVRYIMESLRALFDRGARSMVIRDEALAAYVDDLDARLPTFVQSLKTFDNWYRGDRDRVVAIAPKSVLDFWNDTRAPDPAAYAFT